MFPIRILSIAKTLFRPDTYFSHIPNLGEADRQISLDPSQLSKKRNLLHHQHSPVIPPEPLPSFLSNLTEVDTRTHSQPREISKLDPSMTLAWRRPQGHYSLLSKQQRVVSQSPICVFIPRTRMLESEGCSSRTPDLEGFVD